MKKKREEKSVKKTMLTAVLLCWLLPMLLMTGVIARYILSNQFGRAAESYMEQLKFNDQLCVERLNGAVEDSREASYDRVLNEAWEAYSEETLSDLGLYQKCAGYLAGKYQRNSAFAATILWFYENPRELGCSVYNEAVDGSYEDIRRYWENDHDTILQAARELDTRAGFVTCGDGRLYLVRNLMNSRYEPLGALVMRLSRFYCFGNLENLPLLNGMCLKINEEVFLEKEARQPEEMEAFCGVNPGTGDGYRFDRGALYLYHKTRGNGYRLCTYLEIGRAALAMPFYGWQYVLGGMLLGLVPLLCFLLYQFKR